MKKLRLNSQARKAFQGSSRGFTLIEVVIAMLLLGIIGVAVLSSLSYASAVLISVDRRATAESLAKSQMEYVKDNNKNPYDAINNPPQYVRDSSIVPTGYNITITAVRLDRDGTPGNDDGIQQITVTVSYDIVRYNISTHGSEVIQKQFTLADYKREPVT
ncbi:MAG: type II secretion system GspH family protein [Dehalococcoidia bacterium]|nr:type II secretion system GspH family protein [Dehalococcoidia bacterium]